MSLDTDMEPEFLVVYEQCRAETMTSIERLYALYKAVQHVVETGVPGDFAECGVWRGGSVMMMALALRRFGDDTRGIWLYDTFEGMTAPTPDDVQAATGAQASNVLATNPKDQANWFWAIAPRDVVEANLRRTGYPMGQIHFVAGDVLQTLPTTAPSKLALLRLDTDWHDSTAHELEYLYPRLTKGGILIIDDYGYWRGARKAVDEYLDRQPQKPFLNRIDSTGRLCIKPGPD